MYLIVSDSFHLLGRPATIAAVARVYGGQTAQERTDARRRQFLDAGLEVLGTRGWANTTVRGVCEAASLSTRFFYESVGSLEALALAVYDEIVEETFLAVASALAHAGPDRARRASGAIGAMVQALTDDPRRARVVLVEGPGNEPLARRRAETMRRLADAIEELGRTEYALEDEVEPLIGITAHLVAGGVAELLIAWLDGRLEVTRDELVRDCARLVVAIGDAANAIAQEP
jgi:AcrR family transcriptional regulator